MRTAKAHRDAKALGRAHHDVSTQLAGRSEQGQRQQVGRYDCKRTLGMSLVDERAQLRNLSRRAGVADQYA